MKASKASVAIAAEFRTRIARGELAPGDPLPPEGALTKSLGYSKPVVREALRILEAEGLIDVKTGLGGGARVRHPSISVAARPIGTYLQIADAPVMDVWETRDRMVAGAIDRLARSDTPLDALQQQLDVLAAATGDFPTFNREMVKLSEIAVELSGSVTEYVMVVALRHVVAAELEAATRGVDVEAAPAVEAERNIVDAWRTIIRHIRQGRPAAARRTFEAQALWLQEALVLATKGVSVGELVADPSAAARRRAAPAKSRRRAAPAESRRKARTG